MTGAAVAAYRLACDFLFEDGVSTVAEAKGAPDWAREGVADGFERIDNVLLAG